MRSLKLFRFLMKGVLLAKSAILVHFQSVRIILLILHRVIVSLLTFRTRQRNLYSHSIHPFNSSEYIYSCADNKLLTQIKPLLREVLTIIPHLPIIVNPFFQKDVEVSFFRLLCYTIVGKS